MQEQSTPGEQPGKRPKVVRTRGGWARWVRFGLILQGSARFLGKECLASSRHNPCTPSAAAPHPNPPGGLQGRGLEIGHHVQEVIAEEDPSLQEQEEEADAVPDDPGLLHRQRTVQVLLQILGWQRRGTGGLRG